MDLSQINEILSYKLITISGQAITFSHILLIPAVILIGIILTRWVAKLISKRLISKKVDPNVVHLLLRVFYVIAMAILLSQH